MTRHVFFPFVLQCLSVQKLARIHKMWRLVKCLRIQEQGGVTWMTVWDFKIYFLQERLINDIYRTWNVAPKASLHQKKGLNWLLFEKYIPPPIPIFLNLVKKSANFSFYIRFYCNITVPCLSNWLSATFAIFSCVVLHQSF